MMAKKYAFSRAERLTRKVEFDRVCKEGRAYRAAEVSILALPNSTPRSRLGLVVGRRMGGAPTRNRMKRLIREGFRLNKHLLTVGHDFVVFPRAWTDLRLAAIEPHFRKFFEALSPRDSAR